MSKSLWSLTKSVSVKERARGGPNRCTTRRQSVSRRSWNRSSPPRPSQTLEQKSARYYIIETVFKNLIKVIFVLSSFKVLQPTFWGNIGVFDLSHPLVKGILDHINIPIMEEKMNFKWYYLSFSCIQKLHVVLTYIWLGEWMYDSTTQVQVLRCEFAFPSIL